MSVTSISRRAAMAATLFAALAPVAAGAASTARFREVRVDMSAVRATGDSTSADMFQRVLPGLVSQALGANFAPGDRSAAVLVVRVTRAAYGPIHVESPFGPKATDFAEGAAVVMAGGRAIASYPLFVSNGVMANRDDITEESSRARVEGLAAVLARWIPSQIGL